MTKKNNACFQMRWLGFISLLLLLPVLVGCPCQKPSGNSCDVMGGSPAVSAETPETDQGASALSEPEAKQSDIIVINGKEAFTDFVENTPVAVVDFTATWCPPCQLFLPDLEKVATEYKEKGVKVGKVDTDQNKDIASMYNVKGIPDIRVFVKGKPSGTIVGYNPPALTKEVNVALSKLSAAGQIDDVPESKPEATPEVKSEAAPEAKPEG